MSGAQEARDQAIEQVEQNADPEFLEAALEAVLGLAILRKEFTTDDLMEALVDVPAPREPRVLGAVMVKARKAGWVIPGQYAASSRRASHARPKRVWISLLT